MCIPTASWIKFRCLHMSVQGPRWLSQPYLLPFSTSRSKPRPYSTIFRSLRESCLLSSSNKLFPLWQRANKDHNSSLKRETQTQDKWVSVCAEHYTSQSQRNPGLYTYVYFWLMLEELIFVLEQESMKKWVYTQIRICFHQVYRQWNIQHIS